MIGGRKRSNWRPAIISRAAVPKWNGAECRALVCWRKS